MAAELSGEPTGAIRRRMARLARAVRWTVKTGLGLPRNILVETQWRLGDEVMALPVYGALREAYPACRITALCHYPDLLEANPHVDAINPPDPARRAWDRYICLRSGPRKVRRIEHYAQCAHLPVPTEPPRLYYRDWRHPVLDEVAWGPRRVVVCTGASWETKRWPVARWQELCARLTAEGYTVVQAGAAEDEPAGAAISLAGKTTVRAAACLLRAAGLLICCDSGLMHLGLAAGVRVIALFGPTRPDILVTASPQLTALCTPRDCQGCWNRDEEDHKPGSCRRDRETCLAPITVEAVLETVRAAALEER